MVSETPRVIIVGGGPVGLAASLELARLGMPSVVIEQRASTSWHPKTRNINTRTMEIARGWGRTVYQRLRGIDTPPGWKSPIRFMRSLTGEQLGEIETLGFIGPGPDISPALPVMSSQELMEAILLDAARATGLVELRFGEACTKLLCNDDTGVAIETWDDELSETYTLEGAALVAADGADSSMRTAVGAELEGPRDISHFINCYFRADLERYVGERTGVLMFVANPGAAGVLQPLDARGRWLCQIAVPPDQWDTDIFTPERCATWIRAAAGADDVSPEIVSVGKWRMNASVATEFVHGRVVLCGDAAHQFPPTGGLGVNTGIQGMHNAMWKLALFVRGQASHALLETYTAERRPVTRWSADQSLHNHQQVGMIARAALTKSRDAMPAADLLQATRRYGNHLGVEFGAAYESSAVVPDGTSPPQVDDAYSDYAPTGRPGHRAPHCWLGRGGETLSTLDLFGPGFTLLTGPDGAPWRTSASAHNVASYAIGGPGLEDRDGVFFDRYGIDPDGAVLVRPDGYVAWRSPGPADPQDVFRALGQILAR